DPLFRNAGAMPPDLRLQVGSPVVGVAVATPAYVQRDLVGRLRDASPDAGAYEHTGFATFGRGCAGTGGSVPAIGHGGTIAFGMPFSVDVASAVPNSAAALLVGFALLPTPAPL